MTASTDETLQQWTALGWVFKHRVIKVDSKVWREKFGAGQMLLSQDRKVSQIGMIYDLGHPWENLLSAISSTLLPHCEGMVILIYKVLYQHNMQNAQDFDPLGHLCELQYHFGHCLNGLCAGALDEDIVGLELEFLGFEKMVDQLSLSGSLQDAFWFKVMEVVVFEC
ncbi:hypothetical protein EDD18DRAFT_1338616 [Armillaria luteobubalina]|uniref:Uncharacterized protein n=1 Tax=Armillaria luteobubalina TaxID=153913 RepID=A0AA39P1R1_9AGAR|nr:hypothetical protein EDD18DRAFT_1338616 [Armillaria luteobubalina]